MIPELGQIALIIALCLSVLQATVPLYGAWRGDGMAMGLGQPAAAAQCLFVALPLAVWSTPLWLTTSA